ncbi:MAG: single-stranded-DNA-specific exonuclease RecJ [Pseudomonadota bacterium]
MNKTIRRRDTVNVGALRDAALKPLLAQIYAARGVVGADQLDLSFARLLPPNQLLNVERAAELLADGIAAGARLLIVGDFDADGATSVALAVSALRAFGAEHVDYLVPNRFEFGYGLTPEIVDLAHQLQPDLIVTVDNGIASLEGVARARELGIATLITDHHLAGERLPAADVIVNPNQPGCPFPSKHLAGVGVMFYVLLALRAELRRRQWFVQRSEVNLADYLDLVAVGTVADVVPLDYNNRILVQGGLQRIRAGRARPGIHALLEVASRSAHNVVAGDLGFAVGPRINAAGRLDDMSIGIECLLSEEAYRCRRLAGQLHSLNQDRRHIEQGMQEEALQIIANMDLRDAVALPVAMTLYQPGWHQGVIGILASRIKDRLYRPVIAFADGPDGELKGSARSIPGIHIRDVLDAVATRQPGLVSRFGGHAMAAGLSLPVHHLQAFSVALVAEVERQLEDVQLQAIIESDGELATEYFCLDVASALRFAGPWGQQFPEPMFDGIFTLLQQRIVGDKHLKMVLRLPDSDQLVDAIAFNIDPEQWPATAVSKVEIAYRLDVNEFRGQRSVQLIVEQLAAA